MALPGLIEIIPLAGAVQAQITAPGSKSLTNRALILSALSTGKTTLQGALWSEDTQVMVDSLQKLGFQITVKPDPDEASNCSIEVQGRGGEIPQAGAAATPLELYVGNAGTAARFLAALVCLGRGVYRLSGVDRMSQRPQKALFDALRQLGYRVESRNDRLPAVIYGEGPRSGKCLVSIEESSQFASALLLAATAGGWTIQTSGENAEESPYVQMTQQLIENFPEGGGVFGIEADASSGSYFWGAGALIEGSKIAVKRWPDSGWQMDERFPRYLPLPPEVSRQTDLGDSIMTAIVLAPLAKHTVRFTHLGRLRLQECERVVALRTELTRCGARVAEEADTLIVEPSELHGAEIQTYNDHRMAMCFATLGLKVPGLRLQNPACVRKTFPDFFQKLAAAPPHGLGAQIIDVASGLALNKANLIAE